MFETYSLTLLLTLGGGLLVTGAIAGVLAGLLGVGGGIVIVPVLFYLFDILNLPDAVSMHVAVATSLATIIPTSISSARSHNKRGNLDFELFRKWAPLILVGAAIGGFSARYFNGDHLTLIFGGIALLVSINMALPKKLVLADDLPKSPIANGTIGAVIGFFSSLMGIGGGTLSVPTLTLFSQPVLRAVGTASAFGLVIAVPAVIGFIFAGLSAEGRPPFSLGYVNIPAAVLIFSATIGARIASAINARALKLAFAGFLFLTA
mgnify:CR=1 FL=1